MKKYFLIFLLLFSFPIWAQLADSSNNISDSAIVSKFLADSIKQSKSIKNNFSDVNKLLANNHFLSANQKPIAQIESLKIYQKQDLAFYLIIAAFLFLGILRLIYDKYFNTMFRVFLNTSLRQSQLTDQLLQAKLPSLFFNIYFVFVIGLYIYFLLINRHFTTPNNITVFLNCVLFVLIIYITKHIVLNLTGWLTGFKYDAGLYVFIVFLINKITSILLLPFILIIAFADSYIKDIAITCSLILITLLIILRFLRALGALQSSLKISKFHFLLYIIGIEILPIFLIYKSVLNILIKN